MKEGEEYLLKNIAANQHNRIDGYLNGDKRKAKVIKNYKNYIKFQINGRYECIQKIDLVNGNVEYEEV